MRASYLAATWGFDDQSVAARNQSDSNSTTRRQQLDQPLGEDDLLIPYNSVAHPAERQRRRQTEPASFEGTVLQTAILMYSREVASARRTG